MAKIILTRGLPASGKSTFARKLVEEDPTYVRLNRDDFRKMLFGKVVLDSAGETAVTVAQHGAVENALKNGMNVIVDDTNFFARGVKNLLKIAAKYDAEVEFKDFTDVDLETCIFRDNKRRFEGNSNLSGAVGEKVIRGMYDRYLKGRQLPLPTPELPTYDLKPYSTQEHDPKVFDTKPWAVIVDIDGTIAKMVDRSPYDWGRVGEDSPVEDVIGAVRAMEFAGYKILFTSGRDGSCYEETSKWIKNHCLGIDNWELLMRAKNDGRPDWIVKAEIFDTQIRNKYNIRCVFDDRDQVVAMWRKLGLTCMQVNYGDF